MYAYYTRLKEPEITPFKAVLLFLLCAVWLLTGLIGHDPWKPDEAYGFGLIYHILRNHEWVVPMLGGEPYLDKPPLFYWTGAAFAQLFAPLLPLHDGARVASGFYIALTLLFVGLTGRELFGANRGWVAAIALIGCLGMVVRAHEIIADTALLAGCAMMLYGYALSLRAHRLGGVLLGLGAGIAFLSKGFIALAFFLFISLVLLSFREWRNRRLLLTLAIAAICALPLFTIWPWLLYQRSPDLLIKWLWQLNIRRWLDFVMGGNHKEALYYLKNLPWLAWPAWPLAAWAVWEARQKVLQQPEFQLLLTSFLLMLLCLSAAPEAKEVFALPMLLPIVLLATASLSTLQRGAANALDWFGIMTFALLAIALWWGWAGILLDNNAWITKQLKAFQPGFVPEFHAVPFWLAVLATFLWVVMVWRVGRSVRRSLINWATGITLVWVLLMTLWLPWLDSGKSYRHMVNDLKAVLPQQYNCLAGMHIGDSERAMLEYFGNITLRRNASRICDFLLVQGSRIAKPIENEIGWEKIWEGGRKGDTKERFRLYRRMR